MVDRLRTAFVGVLVVAAFALVAIVVVLARADAPRTRRIHVDLFRYGTEPEIIEVARGDTLVLTFSARDTPHSFFLQEYDLDVKVTPNSGTLEVTHPSNPTAPPEVAREVTFIAGRPGLLGFLAPKSHFRCHVYCGEMHAFEQGSLVVRPNVLEAGGYGVVLALPVLVLLFRRKLRDETKGTVAVVNVLERWPRLRRVLALPNLQLWLMVAMAAFAYAVLLISLVGTKMAGGNLGVLLVWVVWLFLLVVVLVPLGGRVWCTVCPIPLFGDLWQRKRSGAAGGRPPRAWPSALATRIPRTVFFLAFGTVSVLVISQPRWTAWSLVALFALASALPLLFELRAFCRFLCPINGFISAYAPLGLLSLRARRPHVCQRCHDRGLKTCKTGNDCGRACPYGLTVSEIDTNAECGLCLECLRTCSYRNVTLLIRPGGLERPLRTFDEGLQAVVLLTLAIVYCVVFQGPWHALRDMVNIVDKNNWALFGVYAVVLWALALGLVPSLVALSAWLGRRVARVDRGLKEMFALNASAFVPMGLSVWIAFALAMFLVEGSFVLSAASDPLGWGWNLLGTAGHPWKQLAPELIPFLQCVVVVAGFALALRTALRVWAGVTSRGEELVRGVLPLAALLSSLTGALVWFFAG